VKINFLEFKKRYEVFLPCDVEYYSYIKSIFLLLCDIISSSSDRDDGVPIFLKSQNHRQPQSRQLSYQCAKFARQLLHRVMPIDLDDDSWITKYYFMGDVDFS